MKKVWTYRIIFCLAFGLMTASAVAQRGNILSGFEQDSCSIGDAIQLKYTLILPKGSQVTEVDFSNYDTIVTATIFNLAMSDSTTSLSDYNDIENYDILDYGKWLAPNNQKITQTNDWQASNSGAMDTFENSVTFQFWEADYFLVPNPTFTINNQKIRNSGAAQIKIKAPDAEQITRDSTGLAEIKDIIREKENWLDYMLLYFIAGALLLVAGLVWFFWKRVPRDEAYIPSERVLPAHELALQALDELKQKELWQAGQVKEYYTEISYIVRNYLEGRFGIQALESTTSQITRQLHQKSFPKELQKNMNELLAGADIVKFAKGTPTEAFHNQTLQYAYDLVNQSIPKPIDESEAN